MPKASSAEPGDAYRAFPRNKRRLGAVINTLLLLVNALGAIGSWSSSAEEAKTYPRATIVDNEVILEKDPGLGQRLTSNGREKLLPTLSPDGSLVVYHEKYVEYSLIEGVIRYNDLIVVVVQGSAGTESCRIGVSDIGRFVLGFEWLSERWILVQSENIALIDVKKCVALETIPRPHLEISSDRKKIAFVYGTFPRNFIQVTPSLDIGLAVLITKGGNETWVWHPIFPKFSMANYPGEEWRETGITHFFYGQLGWDAASRRLAFVQEIDGKFWLVCLDIEPVLQEKGPIILLREPFEMINPSQAPVAWDGDVVTVTEGQGYVNEERPKLTWTFRCPPAGSPAATTETGPAVPPDPPSTAGQTPVALRR